MINRTRITVFEHVNALVEKDILQRVPNKSRSLTINPSFKVPKTETEIAPPPATKQQQSDSSLGSFPLVGQIAAGLPVEAIEDCDTLDLTSLFETREGTFALEVKGDSMIEEHIRPGDYVLIKKQNTARDGDIVVALLDTGEATLKRCYRNNPGYRLEAANPAYPPIYTDDLQVQGVLIGVIRRY